MIRSRCPYIPASAFAAVFSVALALAGTAANASGQIGTPVDSAAEAGARTDAAADSAPRPLTADAYGQWETLGSATLSRNGEWLAYPVRRVDERNELRIRPVDTDSLVVIEFGSNPTFSRDGRWLAYSIGHSPDDRERLQKNSQRVESRLGVLDLERGDTTFVPGVASFAFSPDGRYLAMRRYSPADAKGDEARGGDLVVRELGTGTDLNFGNIGEFAWQDERAVLAMTVDAAHNAGNGVRVWEASSGALRTLESATADYRALRWREDDDDLLVMRVIEDDDREEASHAVLVWRDVSGRRTRAHSFDPTAHDGFPADTRVVEHREPDFGDDGRAVFFGVAEWTLTEEARKRAEEAADSAARAEAETGDGAAGAAEDTASSDEEEPDVEVWHSRDVDIIPRQKMTAARDRQRNHLAVWHVDDDRFVQLGTEQFENVRRVEGDRLAIGIDPTPHERDRMFGPEYRDIHVIDTGTGAARRVLERIEYFFRASPGGRYLLYLEDDHYYAYDLRNDRATNLTENIPTVFVDTADDHTVEQKPPFRYAGWTEGDRSIVLYDKYDAWEVRPDGSGGERLTNGRADSVVHRYNRVGWAEDQEAIDPRAPAYWNLTGEWTKRNGYAVSSRLNRTPQRAIWEDASIGWLMKAEDAAVFAYRAQSFDDSPDYFITRGRLGPGTQLTATNAFQENYRWGRSELIEFENASGQRLQGALFYPADYEPGQQYPMITYIYEIRSYSVHTYYVPSERSAYNAAVWTSRGYFVFQPDIVYRPRNPGLSAVEAVVPAVERVLETGMIDPERVGLIGHSWGGYQTAFLPTQTDLFAAAVAGAPLTELTSMYLSIYWNFGGTDARIFEISQGRMEVPPWQDLDSYQANSPVHHIQNLDTPMLVAFGDEDGAVDWDQGIVFYNAARRAGKEMVLLVYPGENHSLRQKENQIDYHRRINQWFDHYLKGEPAPAWMSTGVPYLEQQEGKAAPRR